MSVPTPDINDAYLLDFTGLLGANWQVSSSEPDRVEREDLRASHEGVKGSLSRIVRHIENPNVFIHYRVIRFINEQVAHERYLQHELWAFAESSSNPSFHWEAIDIPLERTSLNANALHIACDRSIEPAYEGYTRCVALLQYDDLIVFLNMWVEFNSTIYISENEIWSMLQAVDDRVAEVQSEHASELQDPA